jgi:hypothetical protein
MPTVMDPKRVKGLLVEAQALGMGTEALRLIHHLSRKGTKHETISGMMDYCDTHETFDEENQRVGHRLDFVVRGYREFRKFNFPADDSDNVFEALADAAWRGIPPVGA